MNKKKLILARRKIDKSGIRVLTTTYYPEIPINNSDIFIYTKEGDRLDTLAHRYYGNNTLWWIIAKANNLDSAHIGLEVDKQIRIPIDVEPIVNELKRMSY